jgi:hypothetical protein
MAAALFTGANQSLTLAVAAAVTANADTPSSPADGVLVLHQQIHCPAAQNQLMVLILQLAGCQAPLAVLALQLQHMQKAAAT